MNICSVCKEEKDEDRFPYRDKAKGKRRNDCQDCHNERYYRWKDENPEKQKEIFDRFYEKNLGKTCLHCKLWYKPKGDLRFCSKKCYLLGNVRKKKNGCWEWKGSKTDFGYGKATYNAKSISAHRLSYMILVNEIKDDLLVLHKCDNPTCVNPDHLYLGNHKQNARDVKERKRGTLGKFRFSKHSFKLIEACFKLRNKGLTYSQIAENRNINKSTVPYLIKKYEKCKVLNANS